jgi:hypothetical protein
VHGAHVRGELVGAPLGPERDRVHHRRGALEAGVGVVERARVGEEPGERDRVRGHHQQGPRTRQRSQPVTDDLAQQRAVIEVVLHLQLVRW